MYQDSMTLKGMGRQRVRALSMGVSVREVFERREAGERRMECKWQVQDVSNMPHGRDWQQHTDAQL